MNKFGWLICICVFVFVTIFIVSIDSNTQQRKIQFTNQDLQINNRANEITNNNNTKITLTDSNINNKEISLNSSETNINSSEISNSEIDYSNQETSYSNNYGYDNQYTNIKDSGSINYKNLDDSYLDAALKNAKDMRNSTNANNKPFRQMHQEKYAYKNIDWNTWKSNFVNQILDDSLVIRELDNYNYGTLIYYSFNVDREGRISNIQVKSMTVNAADKAKLAKLIKSYEYESITKFPAKSQRKIANVSAVMMLSNESQHSKPSDFNDVEHVKFKL